jgi:hypothetical protein
VAIAGKAQKGRVKFEEEKSSPVHAVSLVEHETGIVLTQGHGERADTEMQSKPTDQETQSEQPDKNTGKKAKPKGKKGKQKEEEKDQQQEEKKQRSELAVASPLISPIDWKGKILDIRCLILPKRFVRRHCFGRRRVVVSGEGQSAATVCRSALVVCPTCSCKTSRGRDLALTRTTSPKH